MSRGPFDDLNPEDPTSAGEQDDVPSDRGVPPLPGEGPTETGQPGDRLRRPSRTARASPRPRDRRPGRESAAASPPVRPEVGLTRAFLRGLVRHCPRCGAGHLFSSWFTIRERCPRCGFRLQREEGGFLGAMTLNYIATSVIWVALLVVWLVADLPDVHVLQLTLASLGVAIVVPLLFWPFSKTLWAVVDYLVHRSDPDYPSHDAADRASGNGGTHHP